MFYMLETANHVFIYFLLAFNIAKLTTCSTQDIYKNARLGHRIVQTKYGRLHGLILPLDQYRFLRPVEAFLGVPYATPPTKQNRFSPTRAPAPWDGIRISDKYSPVCPQRLPNIQNETAALEKMPKGRLEYLKRLLPYLKNQSEDCLYLNIFSPMHAANQDKKLPVMVFIHGESFEWSSGNPYDGSVLASYNEVVVVTLNYRLGILGFLNANPSPETRARVANYGLMDQMAALHWVQQNIAKFGGDPNVVTLVGHGTGAACINYLMSSPTNVQGLFHRVILLSGSSFSSWALVENPVVYALKLAKEVNCTIPEDIIKHHEQIVDCLREIPLSELYEADIQAPNFLSSFGPSIDGVVIKPGNVNSNIDEPANRNIKKPPDTSGWRYDVLFGVVTGESIWRFSAHDIQNGFENDRRDKILRTYVRNAYNYHLNEIFYTIINEYTDWDRTSQHPINTRDTAVAALSDAQFVAPIVRTGDLLAPPAPPNAQDKVGPRCYFYVFDYQTKDGDYPQRMGTVHGEDLPYIFGAPLVDGFNHFPSNYTKSEIALSEAVMIYWTNFAKTGNPNEHHRQDSTLPASKERNRFRSIQWEEYDSLHQKYLEIGMKPRIKNHFRAHQLSIWLRLIPELHRAGMEDVIARHNLFKNHEDLNLYEGSVKYDPFTRLNAIDEVLFKKSRGNISEYTNGILNGNGITTAEPIIFTTCIPLSGNYTAFGPTSIMNATTDTLSGFESAGYAAYSTALSVTIAIGCSLLILNVLIFAGVYYQRDKTRLEVKSLQKQYQQRTGVALHQQVQFDPIKHAHYHLGHAPSASAVIVDVENHDQGSIILSGDIKSPHICGNTMQITANNCGSLQPKAPITSDTTSTTTSSGTFNSSTLGIAMKSQQMMQPIPPTSRTQTFTRNIAQNNQNGNDQHNSSNISYNTGVMTLPKSTTLYHQSMACGRSNVNNLNSGGNSNINDCGTLPRNLLVGSNDYQQQSKQIQPNGMILTGNHNPRAPRPPVRTVSNSPSPSEQMQHQAQQCSSSNVFNNSSISNPSSKTIPQQQQIVQQSSMEEMRV